VTVTKDVQHQKQPEKLKLVKIPLKRYTCIWGGILLPLIVGILISSSIEW
jgi:hypothetical protein